MNHFFQFLEPAPFLEFFIFSVPFLYVCACARACVHAHLFSCNKAYTCAVYACSYIYIYIYIFRYVYIYIYTHTHKTHMDECMHHDDVCTDLCFSLRHMHAHRLPHLDMLHSRGINTLCGALPHQATAQSL